MSNQVNTMIPAQQGYAPFIIPTVSGYDEELMEDISDAAWLVTSE